jgi:hypothetical protein
MDSLGDIDKAFSGGSDSPSKIPIPLWGRRLLLSFVLSSVLLFVLKPKATLNMTVDEKTGEIQTSLKKMKLLQFALVGTAILYWVVKKYY